MTDKDTELMKKDLVLEYRINRYGGVEPQVELEGLWLPADVSRMYKLVLRHARKHKLTLLREREITKIVEPEIKKEKKDGRGKQKRK